MKVEAIIVVVLRPSWLKLGLVLEGAVLRIGVDGDSKWCLLSLCCRDPSEKIPMEVFDYC